MKKQRLNNSTRSSATAADPPRRRLFLTRLWAVLGGLAVVELASVGAAFLRHREPVSTMENGNAIIPCGTVDRYSPGTVTAFIRGRFYLVCVEDGGFLAVSRQCTHLGCTVPWEEEARQFICPCHASAFDITGQVIHTPATRALDIYPLSIENNAILVDTHSAIRRTGFNKDQLVYADRS